MSGNFDTLDDIRNLLDSISDTLDNTKGVVDVVNHGLKRTKESEENISRIIQRAMSEENERDMKLIKEYQRRTRLCFRRTVIFCILMILVTILICVFL